MSKRDSSPPIRCFETPTTKRSKKNLSEDVPMECDRTTQNIPVAGSSGIISASLGIQPNPSKDRSGINPAPSNINKKPFTANAGPKMNPRASNSPRPSFLCPEPNAWPSPHRPNTDLSYGNLNMSRSHRPKTHRSRAETRRVSLSPLAADLSQLGLDDVPQETGNSQKVKLKRSESSPSIERDEKSNRLDWTGSRM